jgi:hypothetical protein
MYCHWALHVDLHGKDTITSFLKQIDAYVQGILVGPEDFGASNRLVRDFVQLDTFRSELRAFLLTNSIRTDLTDHDERWNEFVKHYAGVVEDGSLGLREENQGLKHVKQVTFVKGREATGEFAQIPFDMMWCVALLDGRFLDINVNARPDRGAGPMFTWGVHLR